MSLFYEPKPNLVPQLQAHLRKHPLTVDAEIASRWGRQYFCLGKRMDGLYRTSFAPKFPFLEWSGTLGYMEFTADKQSLTIERIAVEPPYGQGYGAMMLDWSEDAARALRIKHICVDFIVNDKLERMVNARGYDPVAFTLNSWVKKLD